MDTQHSAFFNGVREHDFVDNDDQLDQEYLPFSEHTAESAEYQYDDDPASFRPGSVSEPQSPHFSEDSHPLPLVDSAAGADSVYGDIAAPLQPHVDSVHEMSSLVSLPPPTAAPSSPTESASDANPIAATPRGSFFRQTFNNEGTPKSLAPSLSLPNPLHINRAGAQSPAMSSRSARSNATNTTNAAPPFATPSERVRVGVDQKSTLWEYYNREASDYDHDLFRGYRETLNSNLLVTTLFFGLVAAFLINALNVSPAQIYANALNQAVVVAVSIASNNTLPAEWSPITAAQLSPSPDSMGVISVTLWGSCVVICLGTMLFATSAKSWLVEYNRDMKNGNPFKCAQRRQLRYEELLKWRVETIISALPWFFQLSLFMFVVGLCFTLLEFHSTPGKVVIAMSCVVFGGYIITTMLPLFIPSCPYNTPAVVLFHRMSRLVSQSVQAGWLYLVRKVSVVLAYCNLTSGSWTLWSKELSKSVAGHRADSHEQQLLEKSNSALSWKAVTWLLTSSQNTATTDLALRSLWNLKYIPKQISVILPTKAPILLYSKLSVELSQPEEFFEPNNHSAPPEMQAFLASASITDFLASLLHLLKCVSLDEVDSAEALACITGKSSYSRLHSELMNVWDHLKAHCGSYAQLDSSGWPYHNLVVVVVTELVHFCIHPDNFLQEKAEEKAGHPLADVKTLLQWHITAVKEKNGTMHLRHHSLRVLLDALGHALWRTDFAVLKEHRKDVLLLLIQLLGTLNAQDVRIFMPLAACFSMFSHFDPQVKKSILVSRMNIRAQNQYKATGSNPDYEQLFQSVGQVFKLYQQDVRLSSEIIQTLFNFAHSTNTTELLVEEMLLELPSVYVGKVVTKVLEDFNSYSNVAWLTQFMLKTYTRDVAEFQLKNDILTYLRTVLCMKRSNYNKQLKLVSLILGFLKAELIREPDYKKDICMLLIQALLQSFKDENRTVLRRCIAVGLFDELTEVLTTAKDTSHIKNLLKQWRADATFVYHEKELEVCTTLCMMYDLL